MKIITQDALLDIAYRTKMCFFLGAGASFSSGIPLGSAMANDWFDKLVSLIRRNDNDVWYNSIKEFVYNREYLSVSKETILKRLSDSQKVELVNKEPPFNYTRVTWKDITRLLMNQNGLGVYYFDLAGFLEELSPGFINNYFWEKEQGKLASIGYHWLSRIIECTQNNVVITTNFDDLLLQAIHKQFDSTYKSPVVIPHSDIAAQLKIVDFSKQPVIFKIHHDFLLSPKNTVAEVQNYPVSVIESLDMIFYDNRYTPLVVGYSGTSDGFMEYLAKKNQRLTIYWTFIGDNIPSGDSFEKIERKHDIKLIQIDGFDSICSIFAKKVYGLKMNSFGVEPVDIPGSKTSRSARAKKEEKNENINNLIYPTADEVLNILTKNT